jgi:uncharacterized phage protein (TIGR01671 family)
MSRVNKYRAWNKEKKIMCYKHEDEEQHWFDGVCCSDVEMVNGRLNSGLSAYEYMQYIGVDDKNGKEIYEDDIVLSDDGKVGQVQWFEEHLAFMIWCVTDNKVCFAYENDFSKIEVIGNVYENADLLKEAGNE